MKYQAIKLDDRVAVTLNGERTFGKVRRIGPVQGQGWAMATLDIDGAVAFLPLHERELANPVKAGAARADYAASP